MKFNTQILILVLLLSLSSGVCLAADVFTAQPFAAFALDSKLGTRSLANQSAVTMAASGALQPRKSANEAFLYSLVIPGMGQLYTGAKRGYVYMPQQRSVSSQPFLFCEARLQTHATITVMSSEITLFLSVLVPLKIGIRLRTLNTLRSMKHGIMTMIRRRPESVLASGIGGILTRT